MSKLGLSLPTKTVPLCTNLDLVERHEKLVVELAEAERAQKLDKRENSPVESIARQIGELEAQMRASTITFTLSALPKKIFAQLEAAHPPRDGSELDRAYTLNLETGVDAIMAHTAPPTIKAVTGADGEPIEFTGDDWHAEADAMSNGQWTAFASAVLQVNRGETAAPFSAAAYRKTRPSEQS